MRLYRFRRKLHRARERRFSLISAAAGQLDAPEVRERRAPFGVETNRFFDRLQRFVE